MEWVSAGWASGSSHVAGKTPVHEGKGVSKQVKSGIIKGPLAYFWRVIVICKIIN